MKLITSLTPPAATTKAAKPTTTANAPIPNTGRFQSAVEACETALAVCSLPEFRSADDPDQVEVLKYFGDDDTWALAPPEGPVDDYVAVDTANTHFFDLATRQAIWD